uniref:Uncharacterized protein n=1 Tax=Rousettus aegyptiacus TaxID=9407 RepID=A0A7J8F0T1_ROUAE|nr:hypothetical protein HJG63_012309 [Rousettus aegyptiacus]
MVAFTGRCSGDKMLTVGLVILVWILYFKMSWPDSTIFRPPAPRPASKSASVSTESPSLLYSFPQELANLTHLLFWPPTPGDGGNLLASTSPQTSTYHLRGPAQASYALGGYLEAILVARDYRGKPKTHGGDLFRAQLLGPDLKAGVSGDVQDLENGTYLLSFPLLWAGLAQVQVRLIHSSEAVGVLRRIWREKRATVDFRGYFRGPTGTEETVICNVDPQATGATGPICQYRDVDSGRLEITSQTSYGHTGLQPSPGHPPSSSPLVFPQESDRQGAPSGHFSNPNQNGSPREQQPGPAPATPMQSWAPGCKALWLLPQRRVALAVLLQPLLLYCGQHPGLPGWPHCLHDGRLHASAVVGVSAAHRAL